MTSKRQKYEPYPKFKPPMVENPEEKRFRLRKFFLNMTFNLISLISITGMLSFVNMPLCIFTIRSLMNLQFLDIFTLQVQNIHT